MHLVVMQVVLWNAPDFFSIFSVIFVSDDLVEVGAQFVKKLSKNSALMIQKSLIFCCVFQCFMHIAFQSLRMRDNKINLKNCLSCR